eukprot:NODE_177_length_15815_cov_0.395457.p1 type:complete len:1260 gc:universal NODE_177_length_15815_cov_0.395457:7093-3314(-)
MAYMFLLSLINGVAVNSSTELNNALSNALSPIELSNQNYEVNLDVNIDKLVLVGPGQITFNGIINVKTSLNWQNVDIKGNLTINGAINSKITILSTVSNAVLSINGDATNIFISDSKIQNTRLAIIVKNSSGVNITNTSLSSNVADKSNFIDCTSSTVTMSSVLISGNLGSLYVSSQCYFSAINSLFSNNEAVDASASFAHLYQSTVEISNSNFTSNIGGRTGLIYMTQSSGFIQNSIISETSASLIGILNVGTSSDLQLTSVQIFKHSDQGVRLIQVSQNSYLNFRACSVFGNSNGWLVGVFSNSAVSFTHSLISSNIWKSSTPIYISGSSVLTMKNNEIVFNNYGFYFIYSDYGTMSNINGLIINNNYGKSFIRFLGSILDFSYIKCSNNTFIVSNDATGWLLLDGIESSTVSIYNSDFSNLDLSINHLLLQLTNTLSTVTISNCVFSYIQGTIIYAFSPILIDQSKFAQNTCNSMVYSLSNTTITNSEFNYINGVDGSVLYSTKNLFISNSNFTNINSVRGAIYLDNIVKFNVHDNMFVSTVATYASVFFDDSDGDLLDLLSKNIFINNSAALQGNIIASKPYAIVSNTSGISIYPGQSIPFIELKLTDKYNQLCAFDGNPKNIFLASAVITAVESPSKSSILTTFILNQPLVFKPTIQARFGSYNLEIKSMRANYNITATIPVSFNACPSLYINAPINGIPNCRLPVCQMGCLGSNGVCVDDNICKCINGYDGIDCYLRTDMYDTLSVQNDNCTNSDRDGMIARYQMLLKQLGSYTLVYRHVTECTFVFSVKSNDKYVEGNDLQLIKRRLDSAVRQQSAYATSNKSYVLMDFTTIIVVIFYIIAIVLLIAIVIVFSKYKNTAIVKSSSYLFNMIILLGMLTSCIGVFLEIGIPSITTCNSKIWIYVTAFICVYGSMLLKSQRIYKIFYNKKGKLRNQSDAYCLSRLVVLLLIGGTISMVYTIAYPPTPQLVEVDYVRGYYCINSALGELILHAILLIFGFIILTVSTWYCINTRNCQGAYKESWSIGICIYTIITMFAFIVPMLLFVQFNTKTRFILLELIILINVYTILVVYYSKKVYLIVFRPRLNNMEYLNKNKAARTTISTDQSLAHRELQKRNSKTSNQQRRHSEGSPLPSGKTIIAGSSSTIKSELVFIDFSEKCSFKKSNNGVFINGHILVYYECEHVILSANESGEDGIVFAFDELEIEDCEIYEQCVRLIFCRKHYFVTFRKLETKTRMLNMFVKKPVNSLDMLQE